VRIITGACVPPRPPDSTASKWPVGSICVATNSCRRKGSPHDQSGRVGYTGPKAFLTPPLARSYEPELAGLLVAFSSRPLTRRPKSVPHYESNAGRQILRAAVVPAFWSVIFTPNRALQISRATKRSLTSVVEIDFAKSSPESAIQRQPGKVRLLGLRPVRRAPTGPHRA
jgi:hypothetical protein